MESVHLGSSSILKNGNKGIQSIFVLFIHLFYERTASKTSKVTQLLPWVGMKY